MAKKEKHLRQEVEQAEQLPQKPGTVKSDVRIASFDWVESLVIAVVVVGIIFTFLFRIVTVNGNSMDPNLTNMDRLVVSNWFYTPKQGDVVVLKKTQGLNEPIVKRVIATEGQTVLIRDGYVYVDGVMLDESTYLSTENWGHTIVPEPYSAGDTPIQMPEEGVVVPEDCIFVLGDNRGVSLDSRYEAVGMVNLRYVLGKAQLTLFPFQHFGAVQSYEPTALQPAA